MPEEQGKMKNLAYISKAVRLKEESLKDFMEQLKQLTPQDKLDLDRWAEEEKAVSG